VYPTLRDGPAEARHYVFSNMFEVAAKSKPNVHVFSDGGEAKILFGSPDERPTLVWARGLRRASLRRAMLETLARRAKLLAAWRRVHGREDGRG
jgi:hypothetical protein